MLYHSRIVEPGSGIFLRVILLVSNVGMIFVPFSEKVTCTNHNQMVFQLITYVTQILHSAQKYFRK